MVFNSINTSYTYLTNFSNQVTTVNQEGYHALYGNRDFGYANGSGSMIWLYGIASTGYANGSNSFIGLQGHNNAAFANGNGSSIRLRGSAQAAYLNGNGTWAIVNGWDSTVVATGDDAIVYFESESYGNRAYLSGPRQSINFFNSNNTATLLVGWSTNAYFMDNSAKNTVYIYGANEGAYDKPSSSYNTVSLLGSNETLSFAGSHNYGILNGGWTLNATISGAYNTVDVRSINAGVSTSGAGQGNVVNLHNIHETATDFGLAETTNIFNVDSFSISGRADKHSDVQISIGRQIVNMNVTNLTKGVIYEIEGNRSVITGNADKHINVIISSLAAYNPPVALAGGSNASILVSTSFQCPVTIAT